MRFVADGDGPHEVFRLQRIQCGKHDRPVLVPPSHDFSAGGLGCQLELLIAVAVRFFSVGGKKIRKTRAHISRDMLYDDGYGVRFGVDRHEKIFIFELVERAFSEALVTFQLAADFF